MQTATVTTCNNYPLVNGTALPNSGIYSRTPRTPDATPQQKRGSHTAPMLRMEVPSACPYEFHQQDARDDDSPEFQGFRMFSATISGL